MTFCEMLGFTPEMSTRALLEHKKRLTSSAPSEIVPILEQIGSWWQDPNCDYAFRSPAGAQWWGKNGGPKHFCSLLEQRHTSSKAICHTPPPVSVSPLCYACGKPLAKTMMDVVEYKTYRCSCPPRFTHVDCEYAKRCPLCMGTLWSSVAKGCLMDER